MSKTNRYEVQARNAAGEFTWQQATGTDSREDALYEYEVKIGLGDDARFVKVQVGTRKTATTEELEKYKNRSLEYQMIALRLEKLAAYLVDKQTAAVVGTWIIEAKDLSRRWALETEGGL